MAEPGVLCFDVSVEPNKAKQLLLNLKGTRLFISEVIYLCGTCFRGILSKAGWGAGLFLFFLPLLSTVIFQGPLAATSASWSWGWKCTSNRCTDRCSITLAPQLPYTWLHHTPKLRKLLNMGYREDRALSTLVWWVSLGFCPNISGNKGVLVLCNLFFSWK